MPARDFCWRTTKGTYWLLKLLLNNIGVWLLGVLVTILIPCLPLGIEWLRKGDVQPESVTLTAAVMAAGFAVTSEHPLALAAHIAFFVMRLILDVGTNPTSPIFIDRWAGTLLIAVGWVHATERLIWHAVLSQPFRDGLRYERKSEQAGDGHTR